MLIVEQSHSRQFHRYLRAYYDMPATPILWPGPARCPSPPLKSSDRSRTGAEHGSVAAQIPVKPKDYKSALKPVWCPGCGDFAVLNAITKALAFMGLPRQDVALITGIGCSSRIAAYTSVYGFHGVHGRALALASGLKAARPD